MLCFIMVLVLAAREPVVPTAPPTPALTTTAPMPDVEYLSCCPGHGRSEAQHYLVVLEGGGWRCGGPGTWGCIKHSSKERAWKHLKRTCKDGGGCK